MFKKSHQKQTPITNTKIIKTIGTNNGTYNEYKPHVKNNPKTQLVISKNKKHLGKIH